MKHALTAAFAASILLLSACGSGNDGAGDKAESAPSGKGVTALEDAEGLSTSAEMIKRAGLDQLLKGPGSYTIFAPSDDAFRALSDDERKALESDEGRPQLVALLRQHMAPGYLGTDDIAKALANGSDQVASLGIAPIPLRKDGDSIRVGPGRDAPKISGQPVVLGNSIVHRIDGVMPPPAG